MKTVKLSEVLKKPAARKKIIEGMRKGDIFIYPTDTIYGIGCNAEISKSVNIIKNAKGRDASKEFSVIAPSTEWIIDHGVLSKSNQDFLISLLPGPYTIIVKVKGGQLKSIVTSGKSLGVRIPKHPFTDIVREAGIPFVTTSLNISGEEPVSSIKDIPGDIRKITDWAIDDGRISGIPSRVFDLRSESINILRY